MPPRHPLLPAVVDSMVRSGYGGTTNDSTRPALDTSWVRVRGSGCTAQRLPPSPSMSAGRSLRFMPPGRAAEHWAAHTRHNTAEPPHRRPSPHPLRHGHRPDDTYDPSHQSVHWTDPSRPIGTRPSRSRSWPFDAFSHALGVVTRCTSVNWLGNGW